MGSFDKEFKEQILKEVEEVKNVALVCKRHNLKSSTVHGWLKKSRNSDQIAEQNLVRELKKKVTAQEEEIMVLRALLKKTYPLWDNEKRLS